MKNTASPLPEPEMVDFQELRKLYDSEVIDLIVVLGPTASGKTKYAVRLAEEIGGEIISADSRQVYRGMDIGTGKDIEEYKNIPYYLIDILPAGAQYNVYDFQKDFQEAYKLIRLKGSVPILCGGTGLYISAVTKGYNWEGESRPLSQIFEGSSFNPYYIGTLVDRDERNRRIDSRLERRLNGGMVEEIKRLLENGVDPERLIS